jgi:hypothetical protein
MGVRAANTRCGILTQGCFGKIDESVGRIRKSGLAIIILCDSVCYFKMSQCQFWIKSRMEAGPINWLCALTSIYLLTLFLLEPPRMKVDLRTPRVLAKIVPE